MSVRKRKGPGDEGEMVEDDEVGEEMEYDPKRVDDKPSPVKETGSAMTHPGFAGGRSRG